jgi:hypothetical protein
VLLIYILIYACIIALPSIQAQHERADNCALRAENDKIRCENIAIREALRNVICPSCGGPPVNEDSYFDEQKLRMENAQLKEEVTLATCQLFHYFLTLFFFFFIY